MKSVAGGFFFAVLATAVCAAGATPSSAPRPEVRLRGLVLLPAEPLLEPDVTRGTVGLDATRLGPWNDPALAAALEGYFGRPIAPVMFEDLRARLGAVLRERFGLLPLVTLPPQEATDGVLQLVITPSRIGDVRVAGQRWFSEQVYRGALPAAAAGNVLDIRAIRSGIDDLNANAYRRVELVLAPGAEPGTTNLTLQARDRLPLRLFASYNDTGTRSTSRERIGVGLEWANTLGRDDTLTYQYSGDPRLLRLRSHALGYRTRLPWRHTLSLSASSARINAAIPEPLDQRGSSGSIGLRYAVPLAPWRGMAQSLSFVADYKRSDNNLLFATIPITDNVTDIYQATLDYAISRNDPRGSSTLAASLTGSPGGLSDRNRTRFFRESRVGARAHYVYGSLELSRTHRLPFGASWQSSIRGQLSSGNLLGSEQLSVGGVSSVRGYDDGEVYGDQGLLVGNELRLPALRGLARLHPRFGDSVQPLVFVDYGWAHVHTPLVEEQSSYHLLSSGVGLRYQLARTLSLSAAHGWQWKAVPGRTRAHRAHVQASLSW